MDHKPPDWSQRKVFKMFPVTRGWSSGSSSGIRRVELLSGMIVWNVIMFAMLLLTVCVQGREEPSLAKPVPHLSFIHPVLSKAIDLQKREVGSSDTQNAVSEPATSPKPQPEAPKKQPKNSEEATTKNSGGDGAAQPTPQIKTDNTSSTVNSDDPGNETQSRMPSMPTEAVLRGFYVFVGIGAITLIYIVIKLVRLRKRRSPGKYRVLSYNDDQEMFPLAAGDGEDEEIFNAAHHQPRK